MSSTSSPIETVKLIELALDALVPIAIALAGFTIKKALVERENLEWRLRKDIEWRQRVFENISLPLNSLKCAFTYVGHWRDLTPPEIISIKRTLDQQIEIYKFLFSKEFIEAYQSMMTNCYITERGRGRGAAIRANISMYQEAFADRWQSEWEDMFVAEDQRLTRSDFVALHDTTVSHLIRDLK